MAYDTRPHYDPNTVHDLDTAQEWELRFSQWDYHCEHTVTCRSNCGGLMDIQHAVDQLYTELPENARGQAAITLKDADGEELYCEDLDERGEDWLADMLTGARFLRFRTKVN